METYLGVLGCLEKVQHAEMQVNPVTVTGIPNETLNIQAPVLHSTVSEVQIGAGVRHVAR